MKRPLAVLAATALATIVGLTPALAAHADDAPAPVPSDTATAAPTPTVTPAPADTATPVPTPSSTTAPPRTYPGMPDPPILAHPYVFKTTARWVNGTLTVVFGLSGPFHEGVSESETSLKVDGKYVESLLDRGLSSDVVSIPRTASAGPARVEVVTWDEVESGYNYSYPTTYFSATVSQQIVKPKKGQVSAVTLLNGLKVAKESHAASYRSSKFTRWVDANRDGEDTRAEVLKAESTKKVTKGRDHRVKSGRWVSAYDGKVLRTASKLEIDHLVPLKEAWTSGASAWSTKKRTAFANDTGYAASLIAVSKQAERAKGSKEPNAYLPAKASARCAYVRDYIAVKHRWGLKVDATEKSALTADLATWCVSPYVAKPGKPNLTALAGKPKPKPAPAHHGGSGSTHGVDPRYGTCTELHRHPNHAPYRRGVDPEYPWYQDRDHDGLVCE